MAGLPVAAAERAFEGATVGPTKFPNAVVEATPADSGSANGKLSGVSMARKSDSHNRSAGKCKQNISLEREMNNAMMKLVAEDIDVS